MSNISHDINGNYKTYELPDENKNYCLINQRPCEFAGRYGYCTTTTCSYWEHRLSTNNYNDGILSVSEYNNSISKNEDNQEIKRDAGKPKLTLVPRQIIFDIAKIREYGVNKYGSSENWRAVDIQRYRDAAFRHFMKYLDDPKGVDEESGLTHLAHLACNIAFLCELEKVTE